MSVQQQFADINNTLALNAMSESLGVHEGNILQCGFDYYVMSGDGKYIKVETLITPIAKEFLIGRTYGPANPTVLIEAWKKGQVINLGKVGIGGRDKETNFLRSPANYWNDNVTEPVDKWAKNAGKTLADGWDKFSNGIGSGISNTWNIVLLVGAGVAVLAVNNLTK